MQGFLNNGANTLKEIGSERGFIPYGWFSVGHNRPGFATWICVPQKILLDGQWDARSQRPVNPVCMLPVIGIAIVSIEQDASTRPKCGTLLCSRIGAFLIQEARS